MAKNISWDGLNWSEHHINKKKIKTIKNIKNILILRKFYYNFKSIAELDCMFPVPETNEHCFSFPKA